MPGLGLSLGLALVPASTAVTALPVDTRPKRDGEELWLNQKPLL